MVWHGKTSDVHLCFTRICHHHKRIGTKIAEKKIHSQTTTILHKQCQYLLGSQTLTFSAVRFISRHPYVHAALTRASSSGLSASYRDWCELSDRKEELAILPSDGVPMDAAISSLALRSLARLNSDDDVVAIGGKEELGRVFLPLGGVSRLRGLSMFFLPAGVSGKLRLDDRVSLVRGLVYRSRLSWD